MGGKVSNLNDQWNLFGNTLKKSAISNPDCQILTQAIGFTAKIKSHENGSVYRGHLTDSWVNSIIDVTLVQASWAFLSLSLPRAHGKHNIKNDRPSSP